MRSNSYQELGHLITIQIESRPKYLINMEVNNTGLKDIIMGKFMLKNCKPNLNF